MVIITQVDDDTLTIGVRGDEVFDTASGALVIQSEVGTKELDKLVVEAHKAYLARQKAERKLKPVESRFDPRDQRADSSPYPEDRPLQNKSSESNPSAVAPAAPEAEAEAEEG